MTIHSSALIIIGCGKDKLDRRAPAQDLYTGQLFQARRAYAEAQGHPWMIISAKYGLLLPTEEIDPYDLSLGSTGRLYKELLRRLVATQWRQLPYAGPAGVELHAGRPYRWLLYESICDTYPRPCDAPDFTIPLDGMGIGEQKRWYKERRAETLVLSLLADRGEVRKSEILDHCAEALGEEFVNSTLEQMIGRGMVEIDTEYRPIGAPIPPGKRLVYRLVS